MAQKQKRPSPLDEPPTASSSESEEEDQHPSSQQRDEEEEEEEDDDEEASSEEQEEDDDEEEDQPPSKNPPPPPTNSHPKPPSSESDTETDSESDSEPDPHAPSAANSKVKPLASKPMEQTPKAKPQPSASATARSASSKRPADNDGHVSDPKRVKKKGTDSAAASASDDEAEEDAKKSGDDSKKLFQRLWSEEDEIAILKGMVEFTSKTGSDPLKHANAFHDFMKKSLHVDASSNQLKQKIRRLKKKFETNAGKGKNGEGPTFSKAHDQKSFELSKKVWGNADVGGGGGAANGGVEKAKSNGKAAKSPKKEGNSRNVAPAKQKPKPKPEPKSELTSMDSKEAGKMDIDEKIDTTSHLMEVIRLGKGVGLPGLNEDVVKKGVELIGASKRGELEEQWKELQISELELYVKRAELVANQARLILEAYKSSNN